MIKIIIGLVIIICGSIVNLLFLWSLGFIWCKISLFFGHVLHSYDITDFWDCVRLGFLIFVLLIALIPVWVLAHYLGTLIGF